MLLSRFNNTCWIDNVDEYCSINSCSMLTKNNNCYNVVGTRSDNNREQLWTMVVDNSCWKSAAQHCWQGAAQHCNKLLTTLIKLFIFACVVKSQNSPTGPWSWCESPQNNILFRNRFHLQNRLKPDKRHSNNKKSSCCRFRDLMEWLLNKFRFPRIDLSKRSWKFCL